MDWFFSAGESYLSELVNGFFAIFLHIFNLTVFHLFSYSFIYEIVFAFRTLGWALFIAGFIIAFLEYTIEAQDGGGSWINLAFNTAKGVVFCSCFAGIPIDLLTFAGSLTTGMSASMSGGIYDAINTSDNFVEDFMILWESEINTLISTPFWLVAVSMIIVIVFGFKIVMDNLSRAGSLLILIIIGSFHAFSIPRGYLDSTVGWCKQVIGLCFTHFMQNLLVVTGFYIWTTGTSFVTYLCGIGTIFASTLVQRVAQQFSLDTSVKSNFSKGLMVAGHTVSSASSLIAQGVSARNNSQNQNYNYNREER